MTLAITFNRPFHGLDTWIVSNCSGLRNAVYQILTYCGYDNSNSDNLVSLFTVILYNSSGEPDTYKIKTVEVL